MGRGLFSGLWDVEAAIYSGPLPLADSFVHSARRTDAALHAARAEAERNGWAVSIAVVDAAWEPLGLVKLDGSPPDSARCAIKTAQQATSFESRNLDGEVSRLVRSERFECSPNATSIYVDDRCVVAIGVDGVHQTYGTQLAKVAAEAYVHQC